MSLQERLGLSTPVEASAASPTPVSAVPVSSAGGSGGARRNTRRAYDPLAAVRRRAHQALLDLLGPQLYDTVSDDVELERRVRESLPGVLNQEESTLTAGDRALAYRQILDEILGHGPIEPLLARPGDHRNHGERVGSHLRGAVRAHPRGRRGVHGRGAPAPRDRQDRFPGGPPG
jgi:pilus assembly protein CpaF